jgi:hypothetical protein
MKAIVEDAMIQNILYLRSDEERLLFEQLTARFVSATLTSAGVNLACEAEEVVRERCFQVRLHAYDVKTDSQQSFVLNIFRARRGKIGEFVTHITREAWKTLQSDASDLSEYLDWTEIPGQARQIVETLRKSHRRTLRAWPAGDLPLSLLSLIQGYVSNLTLSILLTHSRGKVDKVTFENRSTLSKIPLQRFDETSELVKNRRAFTSDFILDVSTLSIVHLI